MIKKRVNKIKNMKYFIIINSKQEKQLEEFQKRNSQIKKINAGELVNLVDKFVKNHRNDNFKDARIIRDVFLGSLRRIDYSYEKIINHRGGPKENADIDNCDIKELMMLGFFVNAKFALEIIKKSFKRDFKKQNQNLLNDITIIKNYLAHADEKFFIDKQLVVARSCLVPQFKKGLDVLEVFDYETGDCVAEINFSINIFYRDICSLVEKISC